MLVDQIKPGDKLDSSGAGGFFLPPPRGKKYSRVYFFAAGSGITPILPLIKACLENHINVVLIYSNNTLDKTIFYNELNTLRSHYPAQFVIEYLFSNAKNILRSRLERGLLLDLLLQYGMENCIYYLCGPELYMLKIQFILLEQGVDKEKIKKENFVIHKKNSAANLPPDTTSHRVTVEFVNETRTFAVDFPETILRAAKRQGTTLAYSCETGSCGNCAAFCKSGEVWLSANEVLMEADLHKGLTLTCTGHPINGDVVLNYQ